MASGTDNFKSYAGSSPASILAEQLIEVAVEELFEQFDTLVKAGDIVPRGYNPRGSASDPAGLVNQVMLRRQAEKIMTRTFIKKSLRGNTGGTNLPALPPDGRSEIYSTTTAAKIMAERTIKTFMRMLSTPPITGTNRGPVTRYDAEKLLAQRAVVHLGRGPFRVRPQRLSDDSPGQSIALDSL